MSFLQLICALIYLEEAWQLTGKRHAVFAMLVKWTQCSYLVSTSLASAVSQGTSSITNVVFSATQQSLNCALCYHQQPLHCVLRGSTVSAQQLQILMGLWLEVLPGMTCNLIQAEVHCQGYITSKALLILPHVTHHTGNIYLHKRNMFSSACLWISAVVILLWKPMQLYIWVVVFCLVTHLIIHVTCVASVRQVEHSP